VTACGSGLDQHVVPARVESDSGCVAEDDIVGAGVEVAQPPGLVRRGLLNQVAQYGLLVDGRAYAVSSDSQKVA